MVLVAQMAQVAQPKRQIHYFTTSQFHYSRSQNGKLTTLQLPYSRRQNIKITTSQFHNFTNTPSATKLYCGRGWVMAAISWGDWPASWA